MSLLHNLKKRRDYLFASFSLTQALEAMGLHTVPLLRIGLPDQFIEHGKRAELLKLCRLDADGLSGRIGAWFGALKAQIEESPFLARSTE